jgi:hypothetical protein
MRQELGPKQRELYALISAKERELRESRVESVEERNKILLARQRVLTYIGAAQLRGRRARLFEEATDCLRENDMIWFRVHCPSNLADIKFRYLRHVRGILRWEKNKLGSYRATQDRRRLSNEDHRWLDTTDHVVAGLSMFYKRDMDLRDTREVRQYEAWLEQFDGEMMVKERYVRDKTEDDEEFLRENCPQWLNTMLKDVKARYSEYAANGVEYEQLIDDINCLIRNDRTWFNRTRPFPKIDQASCPICHIEFQKGAEVWHLRCGHYAHPYCLRNWFAEKKECPICRRVIRDIDIRASYYGTTIFTSKSLSPTPS